MINTHKRIAVFAVFLVSILALTARAELMLNGVATHAELGEEMFIAGLYTTTPGTDRNAILIAQEDKQIQVRVTAEKLSTRRFKRMWIEGMAVNASSNELKEQSNNMAAFNNLLKVRMVKGDIFTVSRSSDGVTVIINGVELGQISDSRFFDLLLRTWLGPVPLSSDFRSALTKGGDIDAALVARFNATVPSDARIAEVEEALSSEPAVAAAPQAAANRPAVNAPAISAPLVSAPTQPTINRPGSGNNETVAIAPPRLDNAAPVNPATSNTRPSANNNTTSAAPANTPAARPTTQNSTTPATTQVASAASSRSSILEEEDDGGALTAETIYRQQVYVTELKLHSNNYLKYPRVALDRGYEGSLRLSVEINREGGVVNTEFLEESEHGSFNRAAVKAVEKADPFPPVPAEVKGETFTFTLPIQFILAK